MLEGLGAADFPTDLLDANWLQTAFPHPTFSDARGGLRALATSTWTLILKLYTEMERFE